MMLRRLVPALSLLLPALALAQGVDLNTITKVEVKGSSIEITGSKKPNFTTFTMTDPPRLVIDISEAVFSGVPDELQVGNGTVTAIKTASYGSDASAIARVLIGFERELETDIQSSGSKLVVKVAGGGGQQVAQADTAPAPDTAAQDAERAKQEEAQRQAQAAEAEKQRQAEAERQAQAEAERKRQQEQAQASAAEAEAARKQQEEAAQAAAAEAKRKQEAEAAASREAAAAAEAERKRQQEEARAAAEAARREQQAGAQTEAERKAEARRAAQEEARAKAEEEAAAKAQAAEDRKRQQEEARAEAQRKREEEAAAKAEAAAERKRQQEEARAQKVAQATPREPPPSDTGSQLSVSGRRKTMELVGFKQQPGSSRVFVRTNEPVRYSVARGEGNTVVVELENTRIDLDNNERWLDTSFFDTAVAMIDPRPGPTRTVRIEIKLKESVPYQTSQQGNELYVDFERPARR